MDINKVSVIIPTFNRAGRVEIAIRSALEQTVKPLELIVIDDGSTDNTDDVVRKTFGNEVILIKQRNQGVSVARNSGVRHSSGTLIAFLDSDDVWLEDKLEKQVIQMENPKVVLSATNWRDGSASDTGFFGVYDEQEPTIIHDPLTALTRLQGHRLLLPTWIVRRDAFFRVGGFDERMRMAEDTRLLFRLAFEGSFAICPAVGTIRSTDVDAPKLTRPKDNKYSVEIECLATEILYETYARAGACPAQLQESVRKLLGHFIRKQAESFADRGDWRLARRRGIEAIALNPRAADTMAALSILVSPRWTAWWRRFKREKLA